MVSTLKIELDGNLITGRIDGIENFTVTYRRSDENGNPKASYSTELTFYDDGYDLIYTKLINVVNGFTRTVQVKIFDDCCGKAVFEGIIRGDSIDWCSDGCYVSANIIEDEVQLNCIQSTLIWDDHNGFRGKDYPGIRYCIEMRPEFLHYILIFTIGLIWPFFSLFLLPIIVLLTIASLFSRKMRDARDLMLSLVNDGRDLIIANCGKYHPSAWVRDYIINVCDKCGLTFQSSILNNTSSLYYNTVLVSAPVQKGRERGDNNYKLISKNLPNETLHTLLTNYLQPMFNAEYRIVNGVLYFERKDYFLTTANWIDYQQLLSNNKVHGNKVCWSWIDEERYALGEYKYTMDASDYCANEAIDRWGDIVEWNLPNPDPGQKGIKQIILQSACARFRKDGIDTSVYDFMENLLGGTLNSFVYQGAFSKYPIAMLIPTHTFFTYKFLIANGYSGYIQNSYGNAITGGNPDNTSVSQRFNYPYWFDENYQNNLYTNFHYIDNPRIPGTTNFNFDFTFDFDCDSFNTFSFDKTVGGLNVNGQIKDGKINEIVVNFTNRTIKVTGIA